MTLLVLMKVDKNALFLNYKRNAGVSMVLQ